MMVVATVAGEEEPGLTSMTIEISEDVYVRLMHEATRQGMDLVTYVRGLMDQEASAPEKR